MTPLLKASSHNQGSGLHERVNPTGKPENNFRTETSFQTWAYGLDPPAPAAERKRTEDASRKKTPNPATRQDPTKGPAMYIPTTPIEKQPIDAYRGATFTELRELLDQAVDGMDLGSYDRRILDWLKGFDQPTIVTIASIITRARATK